MKGITEIENILNTDKRGLANLLQYIFSLLVVCSLKRLQG